MSISWNRRPLPLDRNLKPLSISWNQQSLSLHWNLQPLSISPPLREFAKNVTMAIWSSLVLSYIQTASLCGQYVYALSARRCAPGRDVLTPFPEETDLSFFKRYQLLHKSAFRYPEGCCDLFEASFELSSHICGLQNKN